jgi:hypothetical protein
MAHDSHIISFFFIIIRKMLSRMPKGSALDFFDCYTKIKDYHYTLPKQVKYCLNGTY